MSAKPQGPQAHYAEEYGKTYTREAKPTSPQTLEERLAYAETRLAELTRDPNVEGSIPWWFHRCNQMRIERDELTRLAVRVQQYLQAGGLFNPEMMEHDKVGDLMRDLNAWFHDVRSTP